MSEFSDRLAGYETTKGLIRIPINWRVDETLITDLIQARSAEFGLNT